MSAGLFEKVDEVCVVSNVLFSVSISVERTEVCWIGLMKGNVVAVK